MLVFAQTVTYALNKQVCNQVPRQWCSSPVTFIYIVMIKLCNICNRPATINHGSANYTKLYFRLYLQLRL